MRDRERERESDARTRAHTHIKQLFVQTLLFCEELDVAVISNKRSLRTLARLCDLKHIKLEMAVLGEWLGRLFWWVSLLKPLGQGRTGTALVATHRLLMLLHEAVVARVPRAMPSPGSACAQLP